MAKLLGVILAVLLLVIGIVLANAAAKHNTFRVERAASIKAQSERAFSLRVSSSDLLLDLVRG
jgi:hypothetical protein